MSKIIVSSMISIDGYTEGRGGDVLALPMDGTFSEHNAERVRAAGRLLMGATTFRGMVGFWPHVVDRPDAAPDDRYIADRYAAGLPITVISDHLTRGDLAEWADQTTVVPRSGAHAAVADLRADPDEADVVIFGSRTVWTDLLAHGLVDELFLMVGARIIGDGDQPALAGLPAVDLELLGVRTRTGSANVVLHYRAGHAR